MDTDIDLDVEKETGRVVHMDTDMDMDVQM